MSTTNAQPTDLILSLDSCRTAYLDSLRENRPPPESSHYFVEQLDRVAADNGVERRTLGVRALLHLPRIATHEGNITATEIDLELKRCTEGLRTDQRAVRELIPAAGAELNKLAFVRLDDADKPAKVFDHLHYLRRARAGARYYGLVNPVDGLPVSICSVSPLEWRRVGQQLTRQFGVPMEAVWDISRAFTFDSAPRFSIARLLKAVLKDIGESEPHVQLLTTVVDPNLGFTGVSYRASNWQQWMEVRARPYLYYDKNYMSLREMRTRFSSASIDELCAADSRAEKSRAKLLNSLIFCRRVHGTTEPVPAVDQRRISR